MEEMLDESTSNQGQGEITNNMILQMKKSAPWMKFVSIFSMIFIALALVILTYQILNRGLDLTLVVTLLIYLVYLYLFITLFRVGHGYTKFINSKKVSNIEDALKYQKVFWIITGIILIVTVILFIAFYLYLEYQMQGIRQMRY